MKVSITLNFYPRRPVGGMKVIHEYANYLAEHGHDVTLYYEYSPENMSNKYHIPDWIKLRIMKYRIEIKPIPWFRLNDKIKRVGIKSICDEELKDADIVIATAVSTAMPVANLSLSKGKKVYIIQDFENWGMKNEDVYETYKQDMTNIVVSHWLKRIVEQHAKREAILISNSINTDIFKVINPIESRKGHTITFHYREAPHKGSQYAIETVKILHNKYPDLHVYVVSIDERPKDLPSCCEFLHNLSSAMVAEVNNLSQVFMCSSVEEGFGLPGLEAMACGCAIASTEYRGVLEYAVNKENALLSPIKDAESMANNISRLFEEEVLREQIIKGGLCTVKKRSLEITGAKFEQVLFQTVS